MPSKKKHISIYLTEEEYAEVKTSAYRAGLSLSHFLRLTSLGQPVKSLECERERMELRALKGVIGQIGGLLKQAIAQGAAPSEQINLYLRKVDACRMDIQGLIQRIKRQYVYVKNKKDRSKKIGAVRHRVSSCLDLQYQL